MTELVLSISLCQIISLYSERILLLTFLAVYVKEGLPFAQDLSLENSADSYLCFPLALLYSVSDFFSSIDHLLHLDARFLMLFHLT